MNLLRDLNEQQRRAVDQTEGPVLVLAGAGSGKTRVLVYRIAHILASGKAGPDEIVAVTFTNKAADEMKDRVGRLLGGRSVPGRVGTFHSICLRILRREAARLGYRDGFQVFDTDDSVRLVRECLKASSSADSIPSARDLLRRISSAKNRGLSPEEAAQRWHRHLAEDLAPVYAAYQNGLRRMNAMDFDDLILNVLRLFEEHPDRRELWAGLCRYLLVDEYQDTNPPQYRLIRSLSSVHQNLCVVGDEDQSIYRFRGAEIGNILSFQDDFPDATVLKLTRNYRSTGAILDAANSLVRNNVRRIGKELWTAAGRGETARFTLLPGDREEAAFILRKILEWRAEEALEDAAVLYRTNAQSRLFEEALVREGIPYRIFGSVRFYDRREVRDLMAYLKLAANTADDISFRRVVNLPPRGIGATAMRAIESAARVARASLYDGLASALESGTLPARASASARSFREIVEGLRGRLADANPGDLLRDLALEIGYEAYLRKMDEGEADSRLENVDQLITAAKETAAGDGLQAFLDRASLVSETESVQGDAGVNLMTLHSAKGLEFGAVFVVGLEEGLLPHLRTLGDEEEIEEERRLCYVGMTRAERRLQMTAADWRRIRGEPARTRVSRFIAEIDEDHLVRERPAASRSWTVREEVALGEEDLSDHPDDDDGNGIRVGVRVRHDMFGVGEVLGVEPARGAQKLTVKFRGGRIRTLLAPPARLTPVRHGG